MTMNTLMPFILLAIPVGIFLLVSVILSKRRQARWREAAMLMNARYEGEGLLSCGTITGERGGRAFTMEVKRVGGAGKGKYNVTFITAPVKNTGIRIFLPRAFFDKGCDVAEAKKKVPYTEDVRVFTGSVQIDRVKTEDLTPEEQAALRETLKGWDPAASAVGNPMGKESVLVRDDAVVFSESGVITDVRRLEALADVVTELAGRIEERPINPAT